MSIISPSYLYSKSWCGSMGIGSLNDFRFVRKAKVEEKSHTSLALKAIDKFNKKQKEDEPCLSKVDWNQLIVNIAKTANKIADENDKRIYQ